MAKYPVCGKPYDSLCLLVWVDILTLLVKNGSHVNAQSQDASIELMFASSEKLDVVICCSMTPMPIKRTALEK